MKRQFFSIVLIATLFTRQGFSQATSAPEPITQLLTHYLTIKDALVTGNSSSATASARQFIKILNSIDYKVISEGNINVLLKDATLISETANLQQQRARFANLSDNMIVIAKAVRLSTGPVYLLSCSGKKVSWLSTDKTVGNPYGDDMPVCGEIVETIQ